MSTIFGIYYEVISQKNGLYTVQNIVNGDFFVDLTKEEMLKTSGKPYTDKVNTLEDTQ